MANSKYEYVRSFEQPDSLLPNTFIVVRIDGRGFTKLTAKYKFAKPNDRRALNLMNEAAEAVMKELPDLVLAYGQSDEYSFVFHKDCMLFERRASKLTTTIVSTFTANYVLGWSKYFSDAPLTAPLPSFDGRAVCYPSNANIRDYLSWRQVDCHINNLYNTTFWALVQGGMDPRAAEQELSGTVSSDKNEILFSRFGINYNNEPEIFKKGSVLYRDFFPTSTRSSPTPPKSTQSPPLSHPRPQRSVARPMSQPLERSYTDLLRDSPQAGSTASTPRGPTFLSTSTTPSPPPSPPAMSMPTVSNPLPDRPPMSYPQTFVPVSPPAANGSAARQPLPQLVPLAIPPPTLKPSTRPPPSLNPPNPTTHLNTSPMPSPNPPVPGLIPSRTTSNSRRVIKPISHSASASLSRPGPMATSASKPAPKRSPSMSILESGPPQIPLRISSIPVNAKPRKLSLPSQKSYSMLRAEEKENAVAIANANFNLTGLTSGTKSPPAPHSAAQLRTMKELPSPPIDDFATRNAVMGSEPQEWSRSPPPTGESDHGAMETWIPNPVIPASPPPRSTQRAHSHSRLNSAPPSSMFHSRLTQELYEQERTRRRFADFDWGLPAPIAPLKPKKGQESNKGSKKEKGKNKVIESQEEDGSWAAGTKGNEGRPVQISRTQREKDRKKRGKARIVIEHVDIIKEEFWERRPWILSGRAG